eukprot:3296782-Alexandrium_andersonii.AAC.1
MLRKAPFSLWNLGMLFPPSHGARHREHCIPFQGLQNRLAVIPGPASGHGKVQKGPSVGLAEGVRVL